VIPAVSAPFVHFQLASGWRVVVQTPNVVSLTSAAAASTWVESGSSNQPGDATDEGILDSALYGITQAQLRGSVGSCLSLTRVTIGGKSGEEVGFLFRAVGSDGSSVVESCEFAWAAVQGSRFYSWDSSEPSSRLPQLVKAMESMQRTAVWS
jgi:hypothetical protein